MRWAARLFSKAFATSVRPVKRRPLLTVQTLELRENPAVSGLVFVDLNQDGLQDAGEVGVPDVVVTGTLADNTVVSTTTDAGGNYSLETDAAAVRVQFSGIPEGLVVGKSNPDTGSTVRFLDASADPTDVNLGLNSYLVVLNTYFYDKATTGVAAGEGAIISVEYGADGVQTPEILATNDQVGATFGLTYHPQSDSVYAASFLKRHAGLGPNTLDPDATTVGTTTGGIYRVDRANANEVSILIDMNNLPAAVIPAGSTAANFATGVDPHPVEADIDEGDWLHDAATLPLVGKRGLGGLAASADGRTLYTINLVTRQLIEIPVNVDGTLDTTRDLRRTTIPLTDPGITGFDANDLRPFAVAVKGNAVFVGVTHTAQGGAATGLRALVYAFNPATGLFSNYNASTGALTAGSTPVLNAPLNYARGTIDPADPTDDTDDAPGAWRPWSDTFTTQPGTDAAGAIFTNPQPWLTDIAFDGPNIILGIRDRFGDMGGYQTYSADVNETDPINTVGAGDMLRAGLATPTAAVWTLESNASSGGVTTGGAGNGDGPGGGEYYYEEELEDVSTEVLAGGLVQVPGFQTVVSTGIDVGDVDSGGVYTFLNVDTDPGAPNTAGTRFASGQTYLTSDFSTFGSANGVGNAEAVPAAADIQVGDRVFIDTDADGIQDAGEGGIAGVVLGLFRTSAPTTQVSSATTDGAGNYLFEGLDPSTAYEIRLVTAQTALTGRTLSPATQGTNTGIDSNGVASGANTVIAFTTGAAGASDHTLDVGFSGGAPAGQLTLGNQVFVDANNDGIKQAAEVGLSGVTVQLINNAAPTVVAATATTGANGIYSFAGLTAGTYRVRIAASNFNTGGILAGYTSSLAGATEAANTPDPDLNVNDDDNGVTDTTAGALGAGGFILSGPIVLAVGGEPTNDGDADANTNLSLDFGVVAPPVAGALSLGNTVFNDLNDNGILDGGESGIQGVAVQLIDSAGAVLQSATTVAGGQYTFTGLTAGDYRVRLAAPNFNAGGVLVGFVSSVGTAGAYEGSAADPDNNIDGDDNGVTDTTGGALGAGGFVQSGLISLAAGAEPTTDGDSSADTNLTLDFGVRQAAVANTLTLGNQVFVDANNDGIKQAAETGLVGVTVQLINNTAPTTVVASTVTGANGLYSFANLAAGDYIVRIAAANFNTGGVLAGYTSSLAGATEAANTPDPDTANTNDDDNGLTNTTAGALGAGGFIQSAPITLALGTEPTTDGDTSADTNLTLDFGVVAPAAGTLSLGNTVFSDTNNNGLQDTGEAGIQGVAVQLINAGGTVVASATTDSSGQYTFTALTAGDYKVRLAASNFIVSGPVGVLVNYTSSTGTPGSPTGTYEATPPLDPDNNVNGDDNGVTVVTGGALGAGGFIESGTITLAAGTEPVNDGDTSADTNLSLDFGVVPPTAPGTLTLGNQVFVDANNNGLRDTAEVGLAGVTVQLFNTTAPTVVAATATTAANGIYTFTGLAAGTYRVRIAASNFNTGGVLAGYTSSTDPATPPNPNVNVNDDDNGITNTTAGALGAGGFVESSDMILTVGGEPTNDGDTDANTNLTLDFGVVAPAANTLTLGNQVFVDTNNDGIKQAAEVGLSGVTVQLINNTAPTVVVATATTGTNGIYTFTGLAAGDYIVRIAAANFNTGAVLAGYTSSLAGATEAANTPDPDTANTNDDDNGLTDTTAGALGAGGFIQSAPITLALGTEPTTDGDTDANTNLTLDFGLVAPAGTGASLSGRVFLDYNNNAAFNGPDTGITGVTVTLTGAALTTPRTATTDASGNYTFTNLPAGTYTLTETQPTTPANQSGQSTAGTANGTAASNVISNIVLGATTQATGYTFAEVPLVSTGGFVYEDTNGNGTKATGEAGIPGVTVTLTGTNVVAGAITPVTATTDSTGAYTFASILPGTYTIAETQPTGFNDGAEQNGTPAAATVQADRFVGINLTNSAAVSGGFNFGEIKTGSIAGVVFADADNDGVQDTGETGIAGVTVRLTGTSGGAAVTRTATTGADGAYTFANLGPGTYAITETQPAKYLDGIETAGTAGGTAATNAFTAITLPSGTAATGYLFAEVPAADLTVTLASSPQRPKPGSTVTLTYTVRNTGTAAATAATLTANFGGLTFVSSSAATAFDAATRVWTVGDVAAGGTATMTVTLRVPAAGTYRPTATVATTATELSTTNNSATGVVNAGLGITMQSYLSSSIVAMRQAAAAAASAARLAASDAMLADDDTTDGTDTDDGTDTTDDDTTV